MLSLPPIDNRSHAWAAVTGPIQRAVLNSPVTDFFRKVSRTASTALSSALSLAAKRFETGLSPSLFLPAGRVPSFERSAASAAFLASPGLAWAGNVSDATLLGVLALATGAAALFGRHLESRRNEAVRAERRAGELGEIRGQIAQLRIASDQRKNWRQSFNSTDPAWSGFSGESARRRDGIKGVTDQWDTVFSLLRQDLEDVERQAGRLERILKEDPVPAQIDQELDQLKNSMPRRHLVPLDDLKPVIERQLADLYGAIRFCESPPNPAHDADVRASIGLLRASGLAAEWIAFHPAFATAREWVDGDALRRADPIAFRAEMNSRSSTAKRYAQYFQTDVEKMRRVTERGERSRAQADGLNLPPDLPHPLRAAVASLLERIAADERTLADLRASGPRLVVPAELTGIPRYLREYDSDPFHNAVNLADRIADSHDQIRIHALAMDKDFKGAAKIPQVDLAKGELENALAELDRAKRLHAVENLSPLDGQAATLRTALETCQTGLQTARQHLKAKDYPATRIAVERALQVRKEAQQTLDGLKTAIAALDQAYANYRASFTGIEKSRMSVKQALQTAGVAEAEVIRLMADGEARLTGLPEPATKIENESAKNWQAAQQAVEHAFASWNASVETARTERKRAEEVARVNSENARIRQALGEEVAFKLERIWGRDFVLRVTNAIHGMQHGRPAAFTWYPGSYPVTVRRTPGELDRYYVGSRITGEVKAILGLIKQSGYHCECSTSQTAFDGNVTAEFTIRLVV